MSLIAKPGLAMLEISRAESACRTVCIEQLLFFYLSSLSLLRSCSFLPSQINFYSGIQSIMGPRLTQQLLTSLVKASIFALIIGSHSRVRDIALRQYSSSNCFRTNLNRARIDYRRLYDSLYNAGNDPVVHSLTNHSIPTTQTRLHT